MVSINLGNRKRDFLIYHDGFTDAARQDQIWHGASSLPEILMAQK
jgi:hypothetical protein